MTMDDTCPGCREGTPVHVGHGLVIEPLAGVELASMNDLTAVDKVRAYLTYRERRLDPTFNPYARPHPDLPWVYRGLPPTTRASQILLVDVGHRRTVHDFPLTPPAEVGPRRVAVERPERIA